MIFKHWSNQRLPSAFLTGVLLSDAKCIHGTWDLEPEGLAHVSAPRWWGWTCMLHGGSFPEAGCGFKGLDFWFPEGARSEEVDSQAVVAQHLKQFHMVQFSLVPWGSADFGTPLNVPIIHTVLV